MNNYLSANFKYYKDSNAIAEIGHVQRSFAKNKNVIEEFSKDNFSSKFDIFKKYKEQVKLAEEQKKKKFQKNGNMFLDCVLAFSEQQFEDLKRTSFDYQFEMREALDDYAERVKQKTGLTPLGWAFHADEGHYNEVEKRYVMNYHAHLIFLNYNFNTKKQPLRDLQKRGNESVWSKLQDEAQLSFENLGFQRGESKEATNKKHLEKDGFIAQKQEQSLQFLDSVLEKADLLEQQIDEHLKRKAKIDEAKKIVDSFVIEIQKSSFARKVLDAVKLKNRSFYDRCGSVFQNVYDLLFKNSDEKLEHTVEKKKELLEAREKISSAKNSPFIDKLFDDFRLIDDKRNERVKAAGFKNVSL